MYCGIYKITNKITNQSYIGQSVFIERRWKEHMTHKGSKNLENDFDKYGIVNFTFEILELCEENQLNDREVYWIKQYDSFNHGYNKSEGGTAWNSAAGEANKKEIFCYDLEGNFIKAYDSLTEAEKELKVSHANISRSAQTQGRTGQYQWSYSYIEKMPPYKRKCFTGHTTNGNTVKKVNQYDKNFNYIATYGSITLAAEATGANATCIGEICKTKGQGQRKTSGGYIWRYTEDDELNA